MDNELTLDSYERETKRTFIADFKLKRGPLAAVLEKDTLDTISKRYELHGSGQPSNSNWGMEKNVSDSAATLFENTSKVSATCIEPDIALLYEQIGRLQMESAFFKKTGWPERLTI